MIDVENIQLNENIMQKYSVETVIVFGSEVTGYKHPKSDIDIGVVFSNNSDRIKYPIMVYGDLREEFVKQFKSEDIDIVYLKDTPLSLQYRAVTDGIVLYQKDIQSFANYKEDILKKYFDFKFFQDIFRNTQIQSI